MNNRCESVLASDRRRDDFVGNKNIDAEESECKQ